LAAFIGFAFRQGLKVKPDRSKDPDEWTRSAGGGPPSDGSSHFGWQFVFAREADPAILGPMPKMGPGIRYGIEALLILIPLLLMTYFLFYPDAFNACLAWLARVLRRGSG